MKHLAVNVTSREKGFVNVSPTVKPKMCHRHKNHKGFKSLIRRALDVNCVEKKIKELLDGLFCNSAVDK